MGQCKCGYTKDIENNCDGTHKIVKSVREQIAQEIEAYMNNYFGDFTDAIKPHLIAIARGKK